MPDLPGIGDSSIPTSGIAYAYAALYPQDVQKLALMDAFLPGVEGWEAVYNNPGLWHFRFHGATPEALVKGRERTYFEYYWNDFAADRQRSIPDADRRAYTQAYARAGRTAAGWAYFASFPKSGRRKPSLRLFDFCSNSGWNYNDVGCFRFDSEA